MNWFPCFWNRLFIKTHAVSQFHPFSNQADPVETSVLNSDCNGKGQGYE